MDKPNPSTKSNSNEEDEEDTLSLSGLFMYSDKNIEFWVENRSTSHEFEQDFEFSSEMMLTSHDSSNPVVFCGNVIQVSPQNIKKQQKRHEMRLASKTKSRWYVLMFGFGPNRYPRKMHIRDLKERQTSVKRACGDRCRVCEERDEGGRMRTRGFIRFLGCGGGGTEIDQHETPCKFHY
ncbi:hypothetical protein L1987_52200 [Smallanthus sonchifolius]|uniref:Uncharacterized protein n=1 Tax=Smallanthus sonchifolius TaxID=185202 RepID=A0ACB9ET67_9ASTR|nr:hypothetical protein L1987_52200 [Smallanthus sonchifolius]